MRADYRTPPLGVWQQIVDDLPRLPCRPEAAQICGKLQLSPSATIRLSLDLTRQQIQVEWLQIRQGERAC
jgi:hypothetical protein